MLVWKEEGCAADVHKLACVSVTVFDKARLLGGRSLRDLRALREVAVPDGAEEIEGRLFAYAVVRKIAFPASLREIGPKAFYCCRELGEVSFAEGSRLERVGIQAFAETALVSFTAPDSLREICELAFRECARLREVRLNGGIRTLGPLCFRGTALEELRLPPQITKLPA